MKNTTLFLLLIFLFFQSPLLNAQPVERFIKSKARVATNRASDRTNDEVDRRINNAVDKEFDKLLNKKSDEEADSSATPGNSDTENELPQSSKKSSSSAKSGRSSAYLKSLGLNAPVNVNESYSYNGYIQMGITNWDSKGNEETQSNYNTYFNESAGSFAMEFFEPGKEKSFIIFDTENKQMIILSQDGDEKTGIVTPINYDAGGTDSISESQGTNESANSDVDKDYAMQNPNYKKTGRTKRVSGYSCDEYLYEDEDTELSLWVTKDLPADLYARMFSLSTFATLAYTGYGQGFTMEWDSKHKNSKERSVMTVKEVDKNKPTNIKTGGYNLISLGGTMPVE